MNVLSLFDGISAGMVALERAGVPVTNYYASEIDKYAIKVSEKNYPNIIRLGDINGWMAWCLPKIDLLIGGSPCQGFSFAGKQLNFNDPRSALFFQFINCLQHFKPKYFLLENVKMKKEYEDVISEMLGVKPIMINSALVSAQNRKRLYWVGERVDTSSFLCYNCRKGGTDEKLRIQEEPLGKREEKILGEAQGRQEGVQGLWKEVLANGEEGNNHHLLEGMFSDKQKEQRQKSGQAEEKGVSSRIYGEKQREATSISSGIPEDRQGEDCSIGSGLEKMQVGKKKKVYSKQVFKESIRLQQGVCCLRCDGGLDDRPHNTTDQEWSEYNRELTSFMSALQLGKTQYYRQLGITQPEDKGIMLKDIIETGEVDRDKSYCIDASYWKGGNLEQYLTKSRRQLVFGGDIRGRYKIDGVRQDGKMLVAGLTQQELELRDDEKTNTLTTVQKDNVLCKRIATYGSGGQGQRIYSTEAKSVTLNALGGGQGAKTGLYLINTNGTEQLKSKTIRTSGRGSGFGDKHNWDSIYDGLVVRKLTPVECCRLQTFPDNYTEGISNSQRYKCLGNSWTVDVISWIFSFIK